MISWHTKKHFPCFRPGSQPHSHVLHTQYKTKGTTLNLFIPEHGQHYYISWDGRVGEFPTYKEAKSNYQEKLKQILDGDSG